MENRIKELAEQMGVSPEDIRCLAQSVANGIKRDKADAIFLNSDQETQREFTEAYVVDSVKKFERFQLKLMTNPEAKRAFSLKVFNDLKK